MRGALVNSDGDVEPKIANLSIRNERILLALPDLIMPFIVIVFVDGFVDGRECT